MKRFDIIHAPLSGTNLIEASAGTGKTYTIAGLFIRLILEKQIPADRILVVTFTKAATADLKERIRDKLVKAKEAFSGTACSDTVICALVEKYKNNRVSAGLLENALIDFDKTAIFTIHSFCQRILIENAFETQNLFDTELIADQRVLIKEITEDFWRKQFCSLPYEALCYCLKKISNPQDLIQLSKGIYSPNMKIVPDVSQPVLAHLDPYRQTYKKLQRLWPFSRDRVCELLKSPSLSGNVYGSFKQDTVYPNHTKRDVRVLLIKEAMDRFADNNSIGYPLFKDFEKFTTSKLAASVKKNHPMLSDAFFDLCETLYSLNCAFEKEMEQYLTYLKIEFFKYLKDELAVRKKNKNIQFFDDLLISVNQALDQKGSNLLLETIREKYKAALVDEFQDTDALQCSIFERIFSSKDHALFMIGDPKQAIYSFRGADIYSYMDAASKADSKYTLIENWRADPAMIEAVNTIYSNKDNPFVFNRIFFEPQQSPCHEQSNHGYMDDPPCILWFLRSGTYAQDKKQINKHDAVSIIATQVADEINYLLSQNKAKESDIAVLVRTNRQALIIKAHLLKKNIPSVLYNLNSIFDSHEAVEMERILSSIADVENEKLLGAALATDIMGFTGDQLYTQRADLKFWETIFNTFQRYIHLWNTYGFIVMFRKFLSDRNVRERMLSFPDGDRRLTNILHLSEILHQASLEKKIKPADLVTWFIHQRAALSANMEEDLLRLESDACAVHIVTIHKSKGLEYKIVFCPYAWDGSIIKDKEFIFHDSNKKQALDLGSEKAEENRLQAQAELLSENLRLFYVALTRAKSRCYIAWGKINNTETSALAYLFHCKGNVCDQDMVSYLKQTFSEKDDKTLLDDLKQMESTSKGAIKIVELPQGKHSGDYRKTNEIKTPLGRKFQGVIDSTWGVSSYSSLIFKQSMDKQLSDKDTYFDLYPNITQGQADVSEKADMFSFPKGARAGIFFHDVFEHLDFASPDPGHKQVLVEQKLMAYGYEAKWQAAVCSMIENILVTPFIHGGKDMMLSTVAWPDRVNELAFYFPFRNVSVDAIRKIFSDYGTNGPCPDVSSQTGRFVFSPQKGFMRGFVDLVFRANGKYFILDWKSNFLGGKLSDYNRQTIYETMVHDYYILQYHIYTLAVHKYLENKLGSYSYKKDFGGVFYLFIRGIHPDYGAKYGIYYDCPEEDLIIELGRSFFI
jgi:exodeoxyribonuclease V beta subunit